MKTISGSVISTKPISLSKATSVLNSFVSFDTGASQAVSAYLRHASASFNGLVHFHGGLNCRRSEVKRKKSSRLGKIENGTLTDLENNPREEKGRKKKSEKKRGFDLGGEGEEREGGGDLGSEEMKNGSRKRKKVESLKV